MSLASDGTDTPQRIRNNIPDLLSQTDWILTTDWIEKGHPELGSSLAPSPGPSAEWDKAALRATPANFSFFLMSYVGEGHRGLYPDTTYIIKRKISNPSISQSNFLHNRESLKA